MLAQRQAVLATMIGSLALAPAATAQDFDISWYTIDGGGEMFTSGGDFELSGTIGQHDAGPSTGAMTGGDFELVGGFWAISGGDSPPCEPCDANCDGAVDAFDIEPFLDLLFAGATPCSVCAGDPTGDGLIDAFDIEPFLECLFP